MTVSTRGRYALRVLTDLAEHNGDNYIPLKDIVARQEISQKYLESIMADMTKSGFLDGQHGKGGGYKDGFGYGRKGKSAFGAVNSLHKAARKRNIQNSGINSACISLPCGDA